MTIHNNVKLERPGSPTFDRSRAPSPIPLLEIHMEQIMDLSMEQQENKNYEYRTLTSNILNNISRAVQGSPKNRAT